MADQIPAGLVQSTAAPRFEPPPHAQAPETQLAESESGEANSSDEASPPVAESERAESAVTESESERIESAGAESEDVKPAECEKTEYHEYPGQQLSLPKAFQPLLAKAPGPKLAGVCEAHPIQLGCHHREA